MYLAVLQSNMESGDDGGREENLSTVGSGRVDELFDDVEAAIETLAEFSDELDGIRRRIEANEGDTSSHVRNRITQDADQLADEADEAAEQLRTALEELKRTV